MSTISLSDLGPAPMTAEPRYAPLPVQLVPGPSFDPSRFKAGALDEVSLDDYEIAKSDGSKYRPHVGERIWLSAYGFTMQDQARLERFKAIANAVDPTQMPDSEVAAICEIVARIVKGYSITDDEGQPFPQCTAKNGDGKLTGEELQLWPVKLLYHVISLIRGDETDIKGESG